MDKINEIFKTLTTEIDNKLSQIQRDEEKNRELNNLTLSLQSKIKATTKEKEELNNEWTKIKSEKTYIDRMTVKFLEDNKKLDSEKKNQELYTQLRDKKIKEEMDKLDKKEKIIEDKLKELVDLESKSRAIEEDKKLIEKEKAIDRERKQILDIRERKIQDKEERLQRMSNI